MLLYAYNPAVCKKEYPYKEDMKHSTLQVKSRLLTPHNMNTYHDWQTSVITDTCFT
jgi:hypothetical protein